MDRLFFKYLTPLLAITITPVLAIGLLLFFFIRNNITELESNLLRQSTESLTREISYKNEAIAKNEAVFIENEIDRIRNKLNVMETSQDFIHLDLDLITGYVEGIVSNEPAIQEIDVLDKWGNVVYQKLSPGMFGNDEPFDVGLHDVFKKLEAKPSYVSQVMLSNTTQMPYINIGQSIMDYSGSFLGGIVAQLDLSFVREIVADKGVGKNGFLYIISDDGILISHPSKKEFLQNPDYSKYDYITRILKAKNGTIQQNENLVSFYTNKYAWTTIIEIPKKYALAAVDDNGRFILSFINSTMKSIAYFTVLIILFGLVISTMAAVFITRRVTNAITRFTQATRKIAEGELSHKIENQSNDEMGELADSFNKMTEELRREREELIRSNEYMKKQAEEIINVHAGKTTQINVTELGRPLGKIKRQLAKLQKQYAGYEADEEKEAIKEVIHDIEQLDMFLKELPQGGNITSTGNEFKPVNCLEIFEKVVEKLKDDIHASNASIKCNRLPIVKANANNIFQLFEILVSYPIRHYGNLAPEILVSVEDELENWKFRIKVTSASNLEITGSNGNVNTDFVICKKIAKRHGGNLWVESNEEGTLIYFTLAKFF